MTIKPKISKQKLARQSDYELPTFDDIEDKEFTDADAAAMAAEILATPRHLLRKELNDHINGRDREAEADKKIVESQRPAFERIPNYRTHDL